MPSHMLRTFWGLDVLCEYRVRNILQVIKRRSVELFS